MKTEQEIRDRIDLLNDVARVTCEPVDPDSISSVVGAMARRQAFAMAVGELEWALRS